MVSHQKFCKMSLVLTGRAIGKTRTYICSENELKSLGSDKGE